MTSELRVGGHFVNLSGGKVSMGNDSIIDIAGNVENAGEFNLEEKERIVEAFVEAMKTTKSIAEFGTAFLSKLNILDRFIS